VGDQKSAQNAVAAVAFLSVESVVPHAVCSMAELMLVSQLS